MLDFCVFLLISANALSESMCYNYCLVELLNVLCTERIFALQTDENILRTYPIGKLLLKMSIPTVIAQIINMLYNVVDRIYIGHIPVYGSLALTGLAFACRLL